MDGTIFIFFDANVTVKLSKMEYNITIVICRQKTLRKNKKTNTTA